MQTFLFLFLIVCWWYTVGLVGWQSREIFLNKRLGLQACNQDCYVIVLLFPWRLSVCQHDSIQDVRDPATALWHGREMEEVENSK